MGRKSRCPDVEPGACPPRGGGELATTRDGTGATRGSMGRRAAPAPRPRQADPVRTPGGLGALGQASPQAGPAPGRTPARLINASLPTQGRRAADRRLSLSLPTQRNFSRGSHTRSQTTRRTQPARTRVLQQPAGQLRAAAPAQVCFSAREVEAAGPGGSPGACTAPVIATLACEQACPTRSGRLPAFHHEYS